jgi:hypothetical protein
MIGISSSEGYETYGLKDQVRAACRAFPELRPIGGNSDGSEGANKTQLRQEILKRVHAQLICA